MSTFSNQRIIATLINKQDIHTLLFVSPTLVTQTGDVQSDYFVPNHIHDHGKLEGLWDDDHPQYLTDSRAADLFTSLFLQMVDPTNGQNLGTGIGLFISKVNNLLRFKSIKAGTNVTISEDNNTLTINSSGGGDIDGGTF